jgi:hypothetical protein
MAVSAAMRTSLIACVLAAACNSSSPSAPPTSAPSPSAPPPSAAPTAAATAAPSASPPRPQADEREPAVADSDCKKASRKFLSFELGPDTPVSNQLFRDGVAIIEKRCEDDRWSAKAIECFKKIAHRNDILPCDDLLTKQQAEAATRDLDKKWVVKKAT